MFVLLLVFIFVCHFTCAQETLSGEVRLSVPDSVGIYRDLTDCIDFDVNFKSGIHGGSNNNRFLGIESLPDVYIGNVREVSVSLAPYNGSTKYYEDPVKGMGKMMSDCFGKKFSTRIHLNLPYTRGSFHNVPSGGVGFSFSVEDALLFMFSKSHRAKIRNSKNAVSWKYY